MNSIDLEVLCKAVDWLNQKKLCYLFTVISTWGSAPRPPGSILVINEDGLIVGSVSGGCIEDDLINRVVEGEFLGKPCCLEYGISQGEAQRFGIPCGGQVRLFVEPLSIAAQLLPVIQSMTNRSLIKRSVNLKSGEATLSSAKPTDIPSLEGEWFHSFFGPKWRMLIIGANQLGEILAKMALALDFDVYICDPREEISAEWKTEGVSWVKGMPDDVIVSMNPDNFCAIIAVTHDPKLDDMALLEALKSNAFYVGALGSSRSQENRRERLRMFDLTETEIGRLRGPVGLPIGSRTPAEISISILAELIQVRRSVLSGHDK